MLIIDNDYYNIDLYSLLIQLRNDIYEKTERALFNQIINTNRQNIKVTCPIHKRGQEKKPSCFISEKGQVHCFSCNYSASLYTMISELLFNKKDGGIKGKKYLLELYEFKEKPRKKIDIIKRGEKSETITEKRIVSEKELESYRFTHPYMYKRHLTDEIIEQFDIGFDNKYLEFGKRVPCITFPVKDIEGDVITIIRRAINKKRFYIEKFIEKPIYGLYEINKTISQDIFIVESVFNCLSLWSWGFQAVALIGLGNNKQIDILKKLPNRIFYICMDGDEAGRGASEKIRRKLKNKFVYNINMYDKTDVNDLPKKEFLELLNDTKNRRG